MFSSIYLNMAKKIITSLFPVFEGLHPVSGLSNTRPDRRDCFTMVSPFVQGVTSWIMTHFMLCLKNMFWWVVVDTRLRESLGRRPVCLCS